MRQGCEQFFIEIGRGNRAKNVLRANRVQPPFWVPLTEVATGQTPGPPVFGGGVCRHALWVGRWEFLDNYL